MSASPDQIAHSGGACDGSIKRAFDFLGKRWSGVILATLTSGDLGFADLRRALDGISDSVLSDRLSELTEAGLLSRTVDAGPPVAVTYGLTEAGLALLPALEALSTWASENLSP